MNLSHSAYSSLSRLFTGTASDTFPLSNNPATPTDNNVFSKFIEITITRGETCFLPIIKYQEVLSFLSKVTDNIDIIKISYPLFSSCTISKSTFDAILKSAISVNKEVGLLQITTKSNECYYVGKGIILDKNLDPLLLLGSNITLTNENLVKCGDIICYVSPKVFEDSSNIISRGIIKKVIPYITSYQIYTPTCYQNLKGEDSLFSKSTVIVSDAINSIFTTPTIPSKLDFSDDIWKFLETNQDIVNVY